MLIDFKPLIRHRDFRLLFLGQFVSFFGSMITYVALPYQIFHLTGSSLAVGMIGIVELIPLLLTAFIGGALADSMDRRKLLLGAEFALILSSLALVFNSLLPQPQIWLVFTLAAIMSALNGFHRPALDALTPGLVTRAEIPAVSALSSLKGNIGMIAGPAVGGMCIAHFGLPWTFVIDVATFAFSLLALASMKGLPPAEKAETPTLKSVQEGLRYSVSRQELLGTYLVDLVAMIFGMPMALFPAMAETLGGAKTLGWLYSAPSMGALFATIFSGWVKKVPRHGAAVIVAAVFWGLAITCFGFATNRWLALLFLALAGCADMISGIFRMTIWNETIPDRLRGRMAGIQMISYTSGPLLGNAESGMVAALVGTRASIVSGGALCVIGVGLCVIFLPKFWKYDARKYEKEN